MASATDIGDKSTVDLAKSRVIRQRQEHRENSKRSNRPISTEQKQQIRELYNAGKTGYEIAKKISIGKSVVYKYLGLCCRPSPTWTDEELQILADGYFEKWSTKKIAEKVDKSEQAVRLRMCRYRKALKQDDRKQLVLKTLTLGIKNGLPIGKILTAAKQADIFRVREI